MRIFTKSLLALTLTIVCVGVAKAQTSQAPRRLIKEVDFSTFSEYSMWKDNPVNATIENGKLKIVNAEATTDNYTIQYEGANGISLKAHGTYVVRLTISGNTGGDLVCVLGTWDDNKYDGLSFTAAEQAVEITLSNFPADVTNAHVLLQSGHFKGTIYISKVQVYELGGDEPAGTLDLSLTAAKWTNGWNADASNDSDDNLVVTLTGEYGAKGYPLAAVDYKKYNKVVVEFEQYTGGWGKLLFKNGDADLVSQTFGGISSHKTISMDYDNTLTFSEFLIQGGTGNPTIKVSRVYFANGLKEGKTIDFNGDGFIPAANLSNYDDDAQVLFTVNATGTTLDSHMGWGIGKLESAGAQTNLGDYTLNNVGDNVYSYYIKDLRPLFEADPNGNNDLGVNWALWGQDTEHNTFTRKSIKVYPVVERITIGESGYATCRFSRPVNVEGVVTAYTASYDGSKIVLTPVTEIPAGAGVVIEAAEGEHEVITIRNASALSNNDLAISDGTVAGDGSTIYALGNVGGESGFVKVKNGTVIPMGKAYLTIAEGNARDFIGFGDEDVTGVNEVKVQKEVRGEYYNLAGQRVAQPTKGLYIVNGKKVIVK